MCLAIAKTPNGFIKRAWLKNAYDGNTDGSGFAFIDKSGDIVTKKYMVGFKGFYKALRAAERENPDSPFLIHFRWATHGATNEKNCHPFIIQDGADKLAAIHNGVININIPLACKQSDTLYFLRTVIQPNLKDFLYNDFIKSALERRLSGNKLVFMTQQGKFIFLNEQLGHWEDGVWYSNTCYKEPPVFTRKRYRSFDSYWHGHFNNQTSYLYDYDSEELAELQRTSDVEKAEKARRESGVHIDDVDHDHMLQCDMCHMTIFESEASTVDDNGYVYVLCDDCDPMFRRALGKDPNPEDEEESEEGVEIIPEATLRNLMANAGIKVSEK